VSAVVRARKRWSIRVAGVDLESVPCGVRGDFNERHDYFGGSVAIFDTNLDGRRDLLVGAPHERPGSSARSGVVYRFRNTSGGLVSGGYFGSSSPVDDAWFGGAMAGPINGFAYVVGSPGARRAEIIWESTSIGILPPPP
jgi:hypothetical protein